MNQQLTVAAPSVLPNFQFLSFLGGEGGERQSMDPAGEFLRQEAVDPPLAGDTAFANERSGDDLDAEMGLPFGTRSGMAGVAVRLVLDDEPDRLEPGSKLGANALDDGHRSGTVNGERAPVKPPLQSSVVVLVRPNPSPHT
jgi:hypothetical protein